MIDALDVNKITHNARYKGISDSYIIVCLSTVCGDDWSCSAQMPHVRYYI